MKTVKKILCVALVLIMTASAIPVGSFAQNENVPTYKAEQTKVKSQDQKWYYDIVLDKNNEPRVWITDYISSKVETFVVPSVVDGMRVQSIELPLPLEYVLNASEIIFEEGIERIAGHFCHLKGAKVVLPSSLLMIDSFTFEYSKIKSINFPEGLCAIGNHAFDNCTFEDNKDFVIPESVEYIGVGAFNESNITSIKIGSKADLSPSYFSQTAGVYYDSSINHPYTAFARCYSLKKIEVDKNNPYFKNENGVIYTADGEELLFLNSPPSDFEIPESVEYVNPGAFKYKNFNSLLISPNIVNFSSLSFYKTKIGTLRFANNCTYEHIYKNIFKDSKIDVLTIPASVQIIERAAFADCAIKELYFEEGSRLKELCSYAFCNNEIKTLDLTNCAFLIKGGEDTFANNDLLESVDMTDVPMEKIGIYMFRECRALKEFAISKYTKNIAPSAFFVDTSLEDIDLSNVAVVDSTAFAHSKKINIYDYWLSTGTTEDGYTYNEFTDHISLIGYSGESDDLLIPDTINGKPVTDIAWGFREVTTKYGLNKSSLDSVQLPSNLEYICSDAFNMRKVKEINDFPSSLRYIGENAFQYCNFESVKLNEGLIYVFDKAFHLCGLESLDIPDSVICYSGGVAQSIKFGKNVRNITDTIDNPSLPNRAKHVYISPENPYYCFENRVLYNKEKSRIYKYFSYYNTDETPENYQIPETVEIIDKEAFYECDFLGDITIPASVKFIGKNAFRLSSVTNVHFADGFKTQTLDRTFSSCKKLKTATFGDVEVKNLISTFSGSTVTNVDIPESVENLTGAYADTHLWNVSEINLPENLKVLGRWAFGDSFIKIRELKVPKGVTSIGYCAFESCSSLSTIDFGNVKFLSRMAFSHCRSLRSVDLTGIRYIAENHWSGTFVNCENLKKITYTKTDGNYEIEVDANKNNETIDTVVIGNGISSIKSKAFAGCTNLENALISDSVKNIADNAFENCNKLTIVCKAGSQAMLYAKRKKINYKTFKISPVPDQRYTGNEIKPPLHVSNGETVLRAGTDYSVSYTNNIKPGVARAIAVGLGDYSIYASTVKFNIVCRHNYSLKTVNPTFSALGYTLHTCCVCKTNYKNAYTAPTGKPASFKCLARTAAAEKFSWNKVLGATGYQVQLLTLSGKNAGLKSLKENTYTFTKLVPGYAYRARVRFYIKAADGRNYFSHWTTINSPTRPAGTAITRLAPANKAFTAQWKKCLFTGYQLQYSLNADFKKSKTITIKNSKTIKIKINNLNSKNTYFVRIRTYKTINKTNYFSAWSAAKSIVCK